MIQEFGSHPNALVLFCPPLPPPLMKKNSSIWASYKGTKTILDQLVRISNISVLVLKDYHMYDEWIPKINPDTQ